MTSFKKKLTEVTILMDEFPHLNPDFPHISSVIYKEFTESLSLI